MLPDPPWAKRSALSLCKSIFRMLRDLTYRIGKLWSSWDLCADLWEASREAETTMELYRILQEQPRPVCRSVGDLVPYSHSNSSYISTTHFVLSYSSMLHSQDSLHYSMTCIIKSIFICTYGLSSRRWYSRIIAGTPGNSHWENLEMRNLKAVVVKWWS